MRQTLSGSNSSLTAFVMQRGTAYLVPHSAFHSLETTHMKIVLSQLNDNSWYETFKTLDFLEHSSLNRLLQPWVNGKKYTRELLVLKDVQRNRINAWMVLLSEFFSNQPLTRNNKATLAIFREPLIDGKPLSAFHIGSPPPLPGPLLPGPPPPGPPPPGPFPAPPVSIRHPPLPSPLARTNKISVSSSRRLNRTQRA